MNRDEKNFSVPLTDMERAELESLYSLTQENVCIKTYVQKMQDERLDDTGIVIAGEMIAGRKLRDALLMKGEVDGMKFTFKPCAANSGEPISESEINQRICEFAGGDDELAGVIQLSLVQIVGRIAIGIIIGAGIASILILSAMTAGWL